MNFPAGKDVMWLRGLESYQVSANETLFFPLCCIRASNADLSMEIVYDKINVNFENVH